MASNPSTINFVSLSQHDRTTRFSINLCEGIADINDDSGSR